MGRKKTSLPLFRLSKRRLKRCESTSDPSTLGRVVKNPIVMERSITSSEDSEMVTYTGCRAGKILTSGGEFSLSTIKISEV